MQDIYDSSKKLAGTFRGTKATLSIAGAAQGSLRGALVQNVQLTYQRQITRVLELGSDDQYYVVGNTDGNGNFAAIVGPKKIVVDMVKSLADECEAKSRMVAFQAISDLCDADASGNTGELKVTVSGALLVNVSTGVSVQDFMINATGQFMFIGMNIE